MNASTQTAGPTMDKGLLYLLARLGLLDKDDVDLAAPGQELVRGPCPVHGGDNKTAFALRSDAWFCQTAGCHRQYGHTLMGLVVALADRFARPPITVRDRRGNPAYREAKLWVYRNERMLRSEFAQWAAARTSRGGGSSLPPFSCPRHVVLDSLVVPSWYFQQRGFSADLLRRYSIGTPVRSGGVFAPYRGSSIVPLFDPDRPAESARCVGFVARSHHDVGDGRWRKSPGLPPEHALFNFAGARDANARLGRVILVEGVGDALRCIEAGSSEAVSVLGSNLSDEQVSRLSRLRLKEVVVIRDNDEAGEKLAQQVNEKMSPHTPTVRVLSPPHPFKDIGDMPTGVAREFLGSALAP
jgi:Toprim-like